MNVSAGIVKWPMSVIRLSSKNRTALAAACADILSKWRTYTDETVGIFAETDGIPHNTITPIARATSSGFECDLVLRNNITTKERPLGVFHPNPTLHHIKKENIGLIEVMGLAVLPARLADELTLLKDAMLSGKEIATDDKIASHAIWASEILKNILILTLIMQWILFVMKSAEFLNRYLKMPEYLREINKEKKHLQDL